MWAKIVLGLRVGAAVWAGLVGLGVILQVAEVVPALPKLEPWVWGISLAIIAVDNVGTLFVRKARSEREARDQKLQSVLQTALRQLVGSRELRLEDLGANVYVAKGWKRFKATPDTVRLNRVARYRPIGYPQQSGVDWTEQKGTVGKAWRKRGAVYQDWHLVANRYAGGELTEAGFAMIPEETRSGFSFREFAAIVDKYDEVLAEPIWHPGKPGVMIGVLTLDRAHQDADGTFVQMLGKRATYETAGIASASISAILKASAEQG